MERQNLSSIMSEKMSLVYYQEISRNGLGKSISNSASEIKEMG
jgi:hypothetical protein